MAVAPPTFPTTESKSSKKHKRKENAVLDAETVSEAGEKKRKKKSHGDDVETHGVTTAAQVHDEHPNKKHKVEHESSNSSSDAMMNEAEVNDLPITKPEREKRPKKPKDKTRKLPASAKDEVPVSIKEKIHIADIAIPYTNPLKDESLPEICQRGIAYAYQYAQHLSLLSDQARAAQQPWKFNKGRQNWIIRNITEPSMIPDSYFALAMIYTDSIKGGARDALKKTCKTITKEAKAANPSQRDPGQNVSSGAVEAKEAKEGAKPTSKSVAFAVGTMEQPSATPISDEKRKRAKRILKVLRGKIQAQDV